MKEELIASHACNMWDTGYSRHTVGETQSFMLLRAVLILWDEKPWELCMELRFYSEFSKSHSTTRM